MEVIELEGPEQIGSVAADIIDAVVRQKPDAVLGLATGSSPLPAYRELIRRQRSGAGPSYAAVRTFNLDEYVGLPAGHVQSYLATVRREFTDHIELPPESVFGPDPDPAGLATAGTRYEAQIRDAGGVDVQLLGIGSDGHLAFNEPGSALLSRTRLKTLNTRTRQDNARFFSSLDEVPVHVLTQGLGTILDARRLVLIATGIAKAEAVAAAVEGPLTASCPASVLQLHPDAVVLLDADAATALERRAYYREVHENKPEWQRL